MTSTHVVNILLLQIKNRRKGVLATISSDIETMEQKIINEDNEGAKNPTKLPNYIYPLSLVSCAYTDERDCYIMIRVMVMTSYRNGLQQF
jgi:hypothetical protein